jgi:hypothetical protein
MSSASKKDFSTMGDLLSATRLPKAVKEHLKNHEIWAKWTEIVGVELSRLTSPVELRSKVLEVQVAHQAWAQQLQFLKPSILGKMRALCPNSQVKDLQFKVGKIKKVETSSSKDFERELKLKPAKLSERQEMTLRAVEDPQLRLVIREVMEAAARRDLKPLPARN